MMESSNPEDVATPDAAIVDAPTQPSPPSAVDDVLGQVKERGFITTGEIFAAFPDLEPDADELRDLWQMFESRGVKVLDEIAEELKLEDERRGVPAPPTTPRPAARRTEHRPSAAPRPGAGSRS